MAARPPSSTGRPPKTGSRPPGTASRLATQMQQNTLGTAVPGGRGAQAGALNAQVKVVDRPMTQQGLGGMKTGVKGPQRQVQDKTYYLGLIRAKINELNTEISRLTKDIETGTEESSSYLTYEKRAESLAVEIRDLQGELGDYNTLVDKLTVDEDIQDVEFDYQNLRAQNDKEAKKIEDLFEIKQQKDEQIKSLEQELDQEKRMADNLVNDMNPNMKQRYFKLKDTNEHMLRQLESGQQELDMLNSKIDSLQEELSMSQVKQEAVRLYEMLHELEAKRDNLLEEAKNQGSPAEEREKLLQKVKEDNQEIASLERQTNELQEKIDDMNNEIRQLDMDIEENQGEKNTKYKELKKREESMDEFLNTYDDNKQQEIIRKSQMEQNIVTLLEHMSRNMGRFTNLPTQGELAGMKEDLSFKQNEMKRAESTSMGLAKEQEKLQQDLVKVEQLEDKIKTELDVLRNKITTMDEEIGTFSDLGALKKQAERKREKLMKDRVTLQKRRENLKKMMVVLAAECESKKAALNTNETYAQLGNLEKKWQHHEQNNFVMKEFIAAKSMECDYRSISGRVSSAIDEYNQLLQSQLSRKTAM